MIAQILPIHGALCACCARRKYDTGAFMGADGALYCTKCGTECSSSCRMMDAQGRTLGANAFTYDLLYRRRGV